MFFGKRSRKAHPCRPSRRRAQLQVEALESRPVPYSVSGNAWPHPELITLSRGVIPPAPPEVTDPDLAALREHPRGRQRLNRIGLGRPCAEW
jgi:hypothetical protein